MQVGTVDIQDSVVVHRPSVVGNLADRVDPEALWLLVTTLTPGDRSAAEDAQTFLSEAVMNVLEHAYEGGGFSAVERAWEAKARWDEMTGHAVFSVSDAGMGIPSSMRRRMSNPLLTEGELLRLATASAGEARSKPGRGLGLASMVETVRRRVGSTLEISSGGRLLTFSGENFAEGACPRSAQTGTLIVLRLSASPAGDKPVG